MKKRTIVSVVAMIGGMTPKRIRKIGLNVITVKHGLAPVGQPKDINYDDFFCCECVIDADICS